MAGKEEYVEKIQALMDEPKNIRNIAICSHIHHGKTVLTDNLAAAAGMMSGDLVGSRMLTWVDDQEHERLMTIYGATVTMAHDYEDTKYLINLMDTPGHVDFGADVTQAMRAVDGAVVMVCAIEGIMPQTETVLKQALAEKVKPVLFINKVDRAIKELKLTPEQLLARLQKIVIEVNKFIANFVAKEFKDTWMPKVEDGSVAFGSALKKWAISLPAMKEFGVTFNDIIEMCSKDQDDELSKKAPMNRVVLDMVIKHLPSPVVAQQYRIKRIWKGDLESDTGKQLTGCDKDGKLAGIITKVVYDPQAGMISTARLFSGRLKRGQNILLNRIDKEIKIQQVTTFIADKRVGVDSVPAGNVVGLVGITESAVGETISDPDNPIDQFEAIKHVFDPVVTKAIEPKSPKDLSKLIEILKVLGKEDPTLKIDINKETGETLVSGLGELHLDAKVERKIREKGVPIVVSPPIVVYRETVGDKGPTIEGKSPNKHNKFQMHVEPVSKEIYDAMANGELEDKEVKKKDLEYFERLEKYGMGKQEAKGVIMVHNHCILMDVTKGVQYLNEVMEHIKSGFKEVIDQGPLAREPCSAIMVKLEDVTLHEDAIHRGPAQVKPAIRQAITQSMLRAKATLLEPKQVLRVDTPQEHMGSVTAESSNRRAEVINVETGEFSSVMTLKMPVAEMFGFEASLKSATNGKGFQSMIDVMFESIPRSIQSDVIKKIRSRKGLSEEVPQADVME